MPTTQQADTTAAPTTQTPTAAAAPVDQAPQAGQVQVNVDFLKQQEYISVCHAMVVCLLNLPSCPILNGLIQPVN